MLENLKFRIPSYIYIYIKILKGPIENFVCLIFGSIQSRGLRM